MALLDTCSCHVKAMGHSFGLQPGDLICPCGTSWRQHQKTQQPCELTARRWNQHHKISKQVAGGPN